MIFLIGKSRGNLLRKSSGNEGNKMKIIECMIREAIGSETSWDDLKIEGYESGIKIVARNIQPNETGFSFGLIVGYQLSFDFGESFKNITNGMVLSLESPNSGAVGILRLGDPDVKPAIPNFSGEPLTDEPVTSCFGERFGLQITATTNADSMDLVYLRVCMQNLLSNCLLIKASTGDVINYG